MQRFVFVLFAVGFSIVFCKQLHVYPYGDANEYILTTEALYNHGTANVLKSDAESYLAYLNANDLTVYRDYDLNRFIDFYDYFEQGGFTFTKDYLHGLGFLVVGKNEKYYAMHFWFYSALCVPARAFLEAINGDIRLTFTITNLILFFIGLYLILFCKSNSTRERWVFATFYFLSPAVWYLHWPHPDSLAGMLTFLGCFYFYKNLKFSALTCFTIASLHFQPLAIISLFIIANVLIQSKFNLKLILKLGLISVWTLMPILFSLYVFETPSVIQKSDFLSWNVVDLTRFLHFFTDPNQGVIRAMPSGLFLLFGLIVYDLVRRKNLSIYLLPASIILMALLFMQMKNWNHGMAVVNRYAVWVSALLLAALAVRITKVDSKITFGFLITILVVTQAFAIYSQSNIKEVDWNAYRHSQLSNYILSNYPQLYNPDPIIFYSRTQNNLHLSSTDSVKVFTTKDGEITKFMFQAKSAEQLKERGMNSIKITRFLVDEKPYHDWYYISKNEFNNFGYKQENDAFIQQHFFN